MMGRTAKAWLGVGRACLLVLLALSTIVMLITVTLRHTLFDRELFMKHAVTPAYVDSIQASASENVESECLFFGMEYRYVEKCLDTKTVTQISKTYFSELYDALFSGKSGTTKARFSQESFAGGVDDFFASLGSVGENVDADTRQEIAEALTAAADAAVQSIPYRDRLTQVSPYLSLLSEMLNTAFGAACILLVILLVVVLLWGASDRLTAVYRGVGGIWCACAVCFIPFALFVGVNLPSQLVLNGALKIVVTSVLDACLARMLTVFSVAFGVTTALLLTVIGCLLYRNLKKTPETDVTADPE